MNTKSYLYKNNNTHKQYFFAHKGYDSKKIRKILKSLGYITIIDYNKRRTNDPLKLSEVNLNNKKNIYMKKEQKLKILIYLKNTIKDYQTDLKLQKIVLSHLYLYIPLKKYIIKLN
jgi:vacuolar-type H+-ATPase subunit I/STV1